MSMQKTGEYDHTKDSVAKALGIKKSEDDLNDILLNKVVHEETVTSDYLGRIVSETGTPEEIAYLAYKLGYSSANLDGERDTYAGYFDND